jgi:pilus assembly protein CpaE
LGEKADDRRTMPKAATPSEARWKPLVICPHRGIFDELTGALAAIPTAAPAMHQRSYPTVSSLPALLNRLPATVCLLDVGSNTELALSLIRAFAELLALPVIAVHATNDPDLILRCMRQGASEFLFQPFTSEQLSLSLERLARMAPRMASAEARPQGRVFCLMPGKGGCGATTIACSLAYHCKRLWGQKVLLADLDSLVGTISFVLKVASRYSVVDALANASRMDEDMWKGLVTSWQGLDVLLAPEDPVDIGSEAKSARAMIDYWRKLYGAIVLDTCGPCRQWGGELANLCDELLVVTTNELPALHATQKALACLDQTGIDRSRIRLIVNRYNPEIGLTKEAIETALHMECFHVLPSDYNAVQAALMEGKPVLSSTTVGKGIAKLADRLAEREKTDPADSENAPAGDGGLLGWLQRRFSFGG